MLELNVSTMIFTVINLLILYVLMKKFLFGPIKNIIAKREEEIASSISKANEVKDEADELKKQYEDSLAQITKERIQTIADTKVEASKEYDRIVTQAKSDADQIVKSAHLQADQDGEERIRSARERIADMVTDAASKIAASKDSPENDKHLYDTFLEKASEPKTSDQEAGDTL